MMVVQPVFGTDGLITGSRTTIATPSVEELAEKAMAANVAAATVGGNIATIITQVREANEGFQRTLAEEREMFLRTLQDERVAAAHMLEEERRTHEATVRATATERLQNPELKVEPPEFYEGDPAEIDTWLSRMTYYFMQVRLRAEEQ